jgi:hypothetical protein
MRIIKLSENGKDVWLGITKDDITVVLISAEFWLNSLPFDGLVSAKLLRIVRRLEKDPGYFTEATDTAYDVETAEFLLYLYNGCNEVKIVMPKS